MGGLEVPGPARTSQGLTPGHPRKMDSGTELNVGRLKGAQCHRAIPILILIPLLNR